MPVLTSTQKEVLHNALSERRRTLLGAIRTGLAASGDEQYAELAGRVHDTGDESVADMLADVSAARIDREIEDLRATESALSRLEDDGFGLCEDCAEPIAYARLAANPSARRCLACQVRFEQSHALHTPRL